MLLTVVLVTLNLLYTNTLAPLLTNKIIGNRFEFNDQRSAVYNMVEEKCSSKCAPGNLSINIVTPTKKYM